MACLGGRRILNGLWCNPSVLQSLWHHLCLQDAIMATAVANFRSCWVTTQLQLAHSNNWKSYVLVLPLQRGCLRSIKRSEAQSRSISSLYKPYSNNLTNSHWQICEQFRLAWGSRVFFLAIPRFVLIKLLKRRMLDLNGWWYNKWICPVAFSCSVPRPINIETYFSQPADYTNTAWFYSEK